jgi:hypothetical protein
MIVVVKDTFEGHFEDQWFGEGEIPIVPFHGSFVGKGYHRGGNGNENLSKKSLVGALNLHGAAINCTCCQPVLVLFCKFPTVVVAVQHYFSIIIFAAIIQ